MRTAADPFATRSVADAWQSATRALAGHSESPRLDAQLLLCKVLGLSRSGLIVHSCETVDAARRGAFEALIERRLRGEPVAYLTGTREFWSLTLSVTPDVLVPRPETEVLVEQALGLLPGGAASVLDLGTGSGAIALAIASERPDVQVTASDVSAPALAVARGNARALGLANVEWREGAWFAAVPGERFDMIVANPPYIAAEDPALARLAAEPRLALGAGASGLDALAAIVEDAPRHLRARGCLLLEHGSSQAAEVRQLLAHRGFGGIRSHLDHSGNPRVTLATEAPVHRIPVDSTH